jgi:hypothetical protein
MSDTTKYAVIFRPTRTPVPVIARLRRLLKVLLRGYGFVCVDVYAVRPDDGDRQGKVDTASNPDATASAVDAPNGTCQSDSLTEG